MGVVNDKLFLDIDDIICIDDALDLTIRHKILANKFPKWNRLIEQCKVTQKKIRDVYPELFGNDDK